MVKQQFKSLGLDLNFQVPTSVEEFDQNAKNPGACLAEGINNIIYRGSLAVFRSTFLDKVEAETKIERKTEPTGKKTKVEVKNSDGTVSTVEEDQLKYAETEAVYFNRICAEKGVEASSFLTLAQSVADSVSFDASATERAPAVPKKTGKVYLDAAEKLIVTGQATAIAAKLTILLGREVTTDVESFGKAIMDFEAKKRAEEQKKLAENMANLVI